MDEDIDPDVIASIPSPPSLAFSSLSSSPPLPVSIPESISVSVPVSVPESVVVMAAAASEIVVDPSVSVSVSGSSPVVVVDAAAEAAAAVVAAIRDRFPSLPSLNERVETEMTSRCETEESSCGSSSSPPLDEEALALRERLCADALSAVLENIRAQKPTIKMEGKKKGGEMEHEDEEIADHGDEDSDEESSSMRMDSRSSSVGKSFSFPAQRKRSSRDRSNKRLYADRDDARLRPVPFATPSAVVEAVLQSGALTVSPVNSVGSYSKKSLSNHQDAFSSSASNSMEFSTRLFSASIQGHASAVDLIRKRRKRRHLLRYEAEIVRDPLVMFQFSKESALACSRWNVSHVDRPRLLSCLHSESKGFLDESVDIEDLKRYGRYFSPLSLSLIDEFALGDIRREVQLQMVKDIVSSRLRQRIHEQNLDVTEELQRRTDEECRILEELISSAKKKECSEGIVRCSLEYVRALSNDSGSGDSSHSLSNAHRMLSSYRPHVPMGASDVAVKRLLRTVEAIAEGKELDENLIMHSEAAHDRKILVPAPNDSVLHVNSNTGIVTYSSSSMPSVSLSSDRNLFSSLMCVLKEKIDSANFALNPVEEFMSQETVASLQVSASSDDFRRRVWWKLVHFDVPEVVSGIRRLRILFKQNMARVLQNVQRESRRRHERLVRSHQTRAGARAKRYTREILSYWKKVEREEAARLKQEAREAAERAKREEEDREVRRQARKLNFLLTQTELFSHFMSSKIGKVSDSVSAVSGVEDASPAVAPIIDESADVEGDGYDHASAVASAKQAIQAQARRLAEFDAAVTPNSRTAESIPSDMSRPVSADVPSTILSKTSVAQPDLSDSSEELDFKRTAEEMPLRYIQPNILTCSLKDYQLKGMNWLVNLYEQGINGILADEMGLGKTVQSIALLSHLAESKGIWGPFAIVCPSSTLHNWQQELTRFCPSFKVIPYWGTATERNVLRRDFRSQLGLQSSPFHVLITSYRLAVDEEKHLGRIKWQYLILDEAHAIKNAHRDRWQRLFRFKSRNRLLLTGTPIQNNMAELWALLHFIMPSFFDSHAEFNDWFSKDIETAAASKRGAMNQEQVRRLHTILKPFMLRRVKKDVECEMVQKIEKEISCKLSHRQAEIYKRIRNKVSLADLMDGGSDASKSANLMNIVMHLRKVCNHPDLFERRGVVSPFAFSVPQPEQRHPSLFSGTGRIFNEPNIPASASSNVLSNPLDTSLISTHSLGTSFLPEVMPIYENPIRVHIPKLMYREGLFASNFRTMNGSIDSMHKLISFYRFFDIFATDYISSSLQEQGSTCFSFSRFAGMSPSEVSYFAHAHFLDAALALLLWSRSLVSSQAYDFLRNEMDDIPSLTPMKLSRMLLSPSGVANPLSAASCIGFRGCGRDSIFLTGPIFSSFVNDMDEAFPSSIPRSAEMFLCSSLSVIAPPPFLYASDSTFVTERDLVWKNGRFKFLLLGGSSWRYNTSPIASYTIPSSLAKHLPYLMRSQSIFPSFSVGSISSCIELPRLSRLISDSGKLVELDRLLKQLRDEGHRVLIFCQMTRMMDILEDYLLERQYTFLRLDGHSHIQDRRDMVSNFQRNDDIFCFLLSTRAGGLGINLTAADTVIFYDHDWNPTSDEQAMDRVHRIGQTKDVTVYRLVAEKTIEMQILRRAHVKHRIQKTVYSGQGKTQDSSGREEDREDAEAFAAATASGDIDVRALLLDEEDEEMRAIRRRKENERKEQKSLERSRKREESKSRKSKKKSKLKSERSSVTPSTAGDSMSIASSVDGSLAPLASSSSSGKPKKSRKRKDDAVISKASPLDNISEFSEVRDSLDMVGSIPSVVETDPISLTVGKRDRKRSKRFREDDAELGVPSPVPSSRGRGGRGGRGSRGGSRGGRGAGRGSQGSRGRGSSQAGRGRSSLAPPPHPSSLLSSLDGAEKNPSVDSASVGGFSRPPSAFGSAALSSPNSEPEMKRQKLNGSDS